MASVKWQDYIVWLSECDKNSVAKVGGKNANLGEMIKGGFNIPHGFGLTVGCFKEFLAQGDIGSEIYGTLSRLDPEDTVSIDKASQHIRTLSESAGMPAVIEKLVKDYHKTLSQRYGTIDVPTAVRSSATAEDLPGASFAGQQDTYLWVRRDKLITAIIRCWASLFTPRAISYRIKMGFPHEKVLMSIGVQKMVDAKAAGVTFTLNPLTGDRSKIIMEGNWGLGESVVSGSVTPDEWVVDKVTLEIIKSTIASKTIEHIVDQHGEVRVINIPSERQTAPCLTREEVIELAKIGREVEQHYGSPQDIEWAIDRDLPFPDRIFMLQTRPETVWSLRKAEQKLGTRGATSKHITDILISMGGGRQS